MILTTVTKRFLNRRETAELLRIHPATLARWRAQGIGPPVVNIGPGRVIYEVAAIEAWIARRTEATND